MSTTLIQPGLEFRLYGDYAASTARAALATPCTSRARAYLSENSPFFCLYLPRYVGEAEAKAEGTEKSAIPELGSGLDPDALGLSADRARPKLTAEFDRAVRAAEQGLHANRFASVKDGRLKLKKRDAMAIPRALRGCVPRSAPACHASASRICYRTSTNGAGPERISDAAFHLGDDESGLTAMPQSTAQTTLLTLKVPLSATVTSAAWATKVLRNSCTAIPMPLPFGSDLPPTDFFCGELQDSACRG